RRAGCRLPGRGARRRAAARGRGPLRRRGGRARRRGTCVGILEREFKAHEKRAQYSRGPNKKHERRPRISCYRYEVIAPCRSPPDNRPASLGNAPVRRSLLRIILVAVPICGATVAFAKLAGPPRGVTGAWAVGSRTAEPNCLYCHNPDHPLNDPGGKLEILDVPAQFQPDTDYPLRVRLSHVWDPLPPSPHWGFELTAVRADSGTGYGAFVTGAGTRIATQSRPGEDPTRNYISHNLAGLHIGDPGPVEWSFVWHSPAYFAAKVYFF